MVDRAPVRLPRARPKWRVAGLALLQAALALGPASCGEPARESRGPRAVEVGLARAQTRMLEETIAATGTLVAPEAVVVTSEVTGRVAAIHFREGRPVAAGERLVTLDRETEQARRAEARAELEEASRVLERQEALAARDFASQARIDRLRTAQARARAELEAAEEAFEDRRIEAPFAGVTGRRLVSVGALLAPGDAVTRLVQTRSLDLLFEVPERSIGHLRNGLVVRARSAAHPDRAFLGETRFVGTEVDPTTRTLPVEARLDNQAGLLKPGMFMQVELVLGEREAVVVPEEALVTLGPTSSVFVVDAEDVARRVPVEPGVRRAGRVEIRRGLDSGDRIVVSGLQAVRDGVPVRVAGARQGESAS